MFVASLLVLLATLSAIHATANQSAECQIYCHFGSPAQRQACGCDEPATVETGGQAPEAQPDNDDPWADGQLTIDEVYQSAKDFHMGAMDGVRMYSATERTSVSPIARKVFKKKEVIDGIPSFREIGPVELNQIVLEGEAEQAAQAAAANPESRQAAKTARDAEAISQIDPKEFLAVLGDAIDIIRTEGAADPDAAPLIEAAEGGFRIIGLELDKAGIEMEAAEESDREAREREAILNIVDFGAAERAIFWDHPSLTIGVGIYNSSAPSDVRFRELPPPCDAVRRHVAQACQDQLESLVYADKVVAIVLKSSPQHVIRDPAVEGSYTITHAEKWLEASMLMVRIQDFGSLGHYRATRGIKTRFEVIAADASGLSELTVERETKDYQSFSDLELPIQVVDRVMGIGLPVQEVKTTLSNVEANPPPPTRAELAEALIGEQE